MDFVRKRKKNYNTTQTTAMVDVDWRVSFPSPLTPKASLLQSLSYTFSDFNHRSLKNPVNPTGSSHSNKTPLPQQPVERLVDAYRGVLQTEAQRPCCLKGLSGCLLISSKSSTGQQQMKGRHLASTQLLQDCTPQLPPQPCTCSCLAPSFLTCIPETWMSRAGQGPQCCLQLGLAHVGHLASFFLWHTSSAGATWLRL